MNWRPPQIYKKSEKLGQELNPYCLLTCQRHFSLFECDPTPCMKNFVDSSTPPPDKIGDHDCPPKKVRRRLPRLRLIQKFHLIRRYCEIYNYHWPNTSCLKYTVNSNFYLIRSKTLPTNDFELTVPDLYITLRFNVFYTTFRLTQLNYFHSKIVLVKTSQF